MTDYWLPSWWNWIEDWSRCRACLEYNHVPCVSCEIPPGMLGLACLVGGGTAVIGGNLRGNQTIATAQQAQAAARMNPVQAAHADPASGVKCILEQQDVQNAIGRQLLRNRRVDR